MKHKSILIGPAVSVIIGLTAVSAGAVTLDLTGGSSGTINGGIFSTGTSTDPGFSARGATGTGVFNPFLRIQKKPEEEGYNTDRANGDQEFEEKPGIWTRSFTYADLKASLSDTADSFEFLLDINETASKSPISLDSVRIFNAGSNKDATDGSGGFLSFGDGTNPFAGQFGEIWNMDGAGDSEVLLDYNLVGSGSGRADMSLTLTKALFDNAGTSDGDYIIF